MHPTHRYDNIINLSRPVARRRNPMTNYDRAAQFSPFAALTGYDAVIEETGRLTDIQAELDEGGKQLLDEKLQIIRERLAEHPRVRLTVFVPDARKSGGAYREIEGRVKKIDPVTRCIMLTDGAVIPSERIYGIDCDLLISSGDGMIGEINFPEGYHELSQG
jgi:hypothetical protein